VQLETILAAKLQSIPPPSGQLQAIAFLDDLRTGAGLIRLLNPRALISAYIRIAVHVLVVNLE